MRRRFHWKFAVCGHADHRANFKKRSCGRSEHTSHQNPAWLVKELLKYTVGRGEGR